MTKRQTVPLNTEVIIKIWKEVKAETVSVLRLRQLLMYYSNPSLMLLPRSNVNYFEWGGHEVIGVGNSKHPSHKPGTWS